MNERFRTHQLEWWIGVVRLAAVPFAVLQIALTNDYPPGERLAAWALTAAFAAGALVLFLLAQRPTGTRFAYVALAFDFAVVCAYVILFAFEPGTPTRQLLLVGVVEGAVRFGVAGGVATAAAAVPAAAWFEARRSGFVHGGYRIDYVTFQAGVGLIMALLVGWLVSRVTAERALAEQRASEAESLRDELGRRADLLESANRCARALSSSLDLDEAFSAFLRELRAFVPFERMAIVLVDEDVARVIATSGTRADEVMPPGSRISLERNVLTEVVARGQTIVRGRMPDDRYAEEERLVELGIQSRLVAPLQVGARTIGLISVGRAEPDAFDDHDVELMTLLGRLAASAIQNIRAYESERRTVDELRRLSALRADFVSLVSHELRSPMAAVIGAARTLQQRWRELQPGQREAFLALIADETTRLAELIGDVLDTSRIDAGTFTYRFRDVDLVALVHETVATALVGQDEVPVLADVPATLPLIRGDADRLRQVLANLIDNAVKYSPAGRAVEVRAAQRDGSVVVSVSDGGPGIAHDEHRLIFEKFGRVASGNSKPGTGLGLYIARSIAEAHGGTLDVASTPGRGATFTLRLPV